MAQGAFRPSVDVAWAAAAACLIRVAGVDSYRAHHEELLDEIERRRAAGFRQPAGRARFVVGAVLLKVAVAQALGREPASIRIDRRCPECGQPHGRPTIPESDLDVSVSHSGSLVLAGVTRAGRLGVDLEDRTARRLMPPASTFLADSEPVHHPDDLLTYWCRKESVVKAVGRGSYVPLREVVVTPPAEPPKLVSFQGAHPDATIVDLSVGEGYAAALTVLATEPLIVEIRRIDVLP